MIFKNFIDITYKIQHYNINFQTLKHASFFSTWEWVNGKGINQKRTKISQDLLIEHLNECM